MNNQKDNTKKEQENKAIRTMSTTKVHNYYNVFDHDEYVALAQRSQKIVTAIYMLTDFLESGDAVRNTLRNESTLAMRDLFSLVHAPKTERMRLLSKTVNTLFAVHSYLDVIYNSGFVSDMNYKVVGNEVQKLQSDVHTCIENNTTQKTEQNRNHIISDFSFSDSFFETEKRHISTAQEPTQTQNVEESVKDNIAEESDNKKTSTESPVFVEKKSFAETILEKKSQQAVKQKKTPKRNSAKDERKDNILKILRQKRNASINDICALFKDCSSKTIQRDLSDLIDEGLVVKKGSRRWSTYNLT